jgi:hypothetical protein
MKPRFRGMTERYLTLTSSYRKRQIIIWKNPMNSGYNQLKSTFYGLQVSQLPKALLQNN